MSTVDSPYPSSFQVAQNFMNLKRARKIINKMGTYVLGTNASIKSLHTSGRICGSSFELSLVSKLIKTSKDSGVEVEVTSVHKCSREGGGK